MIGGGLGAKNETTSKLERLKGESQENGGRGIPCKLLAILKIFCQCNKNGFSGFKRLKPTCTSRGEVDTMKFYLKLLPAQEVTCKAKSFCLTSLKCYAVAS